MNLPPIIYIRTQDSDTLFAVKSTVFTEDGAIPAGTLLRQMFDGKTLPPPTPICYKDDDIPVFFLPIPSEFFKLMQQGFMFPNSLRYLRDSLPDDATKELWDKHVEHYGLAWTPPELVTSVCTPRNLSKGIISASYASWQQFKKESERQLGLSTKRLVCYEYSFSKQKSNASFAFVDHDYKILSLEMHLSASDEPDVLKYIYDRV